MPRWAGYMRKPFQVDKLLALLETEPNLGGGTGAATNPRAAAGREP